MIYNLCLLIFFLLFSPKLLLSRLKGKRHPAFIQRLGFSLPQLKNTIWLHAVSVGEVKASGPFVALLKQKFPHHNFCITTTTATGFEEAKKIPADAHLFLPLDFSFSAETFVRKVDPKMLFLIEGDLWPNLLKSVKNKGGKAFIVSGKMSHRSFQWYSLFPKFSSQLFKNLDGIFVQSEEHALRFIPFAPDKVKVTGNLKFDMIAQIKEDHPRSFITLASTHAGEEELLLDALQGYSLFIAPRHPERFSEVAALLAQKNISFARFSEKKSAKVILVDVMGELAFCYSRSKIAIVGGSFIPYVGGHNLIEPALYGCPCIFGPYTYKQKEMTQRVLEADAGIRVDPAGLSCAVQTILADHANFSKRASSMIERLRGASKATWQEIEKSTI